MQTEKEALAVILGCEHFKLYLLGSKFVIETDHKPLEILYSANSRLSARLERWMLRLQQFDYDLVYKKGEENVADPFSRLLKVDDDGLRSTDVREKSATEKYVHFISKQAVPRCVTLDEVIQSTQNDETLQRVCKMLNDGNVKKLPDEFSRVHKELCVTSDSVLLRGTRIVVPVDLRKRMLTLLHEGHSGIVKMKAAARTKTW